MFAEIAAKRVELIKEAIPTLTRVAVFVNPANQSTPIALTAMQHMAGSLGVELWWTKFLMSLQRLLVGLAWLALIALCNQQRFAAVVRSQTRSAPPKRPTPKIGRDRSLQFQFIARAADRNAGGFSSLIDINVTGSVTSNPFGGVASLQIVCAA